jgi:hypothetical protein
MDLLNLHKLFQMALETECIAKVRDILQVVPYCHGYSRIMNERHYQVYNSLDDEKGFYKHEKEYEYVNM